MRMYTLEEGKRMVRAARKAVKSYVSSHRFDRTEADRHAFGLDKRHGVFVTIAHYPTMEVRGSMGFVSAEQPLGREVVDAAVAAASQDPRYVPVSHLELEHIVIEACVVGRTEPVRSIGAAGPVGGISRADGLYIEYGFNRGVLLPTAVGTGWPAEKMLDRLCANAGLPEHAWRRHGVEIFRFGAQAFRETEPDGDVEEIKLG